MRIPMKRLTSRLQELYAYYRYGPSVTWRELPVIIVTDLPLLLVLPLLPASWWLWCVIFTLWQLVSVMLFCLYREMKMKKHNERHE